eukprot:6182385-Pleurochrysis_carterae.AAC.1
MTESYRLARDTVVLSKWRPWAVSPSTQRTPLHAKAEVEERREECTQVKPKPREVSMIKRMYGRENRALRLVLVVVLEEVRLDRILMGTGDLASLEKSSTGKFVKEDEQLRLQAEPRVQEAKKRSRMMGVVLVALLQQQRPVRITKYPRNLKGRPKRKLDGYVRISSRSAQASHRINKDRLILEQSWSGTEKYIERRAGEGRGRRYRGLLAPKALSGSFGSVVTREKPEERDGAGGVCARTCMATVYARQAGKLLKHPRHYFASTNALV